MFRQRTLNHRLVCYVASTTSDNDEAVFCGTNGDSSSLTPLPTSTIIAAGLATNTNPAERFVGAKIFKFVLEEHKPLGCTAKESLALADEDDKDAKDFFVSKKAGTPVRQAYKLETLSSESWLRLTTL